jgi:exopolysaccharide biosynthesis polyprenyl glycosylphosphotransferase
VTPPGFPAPLDAAPEAVLAGSAPPRRLTPAPQPHAALVPPLLFTAAAVLLAGGADVLSAASHETGVGLRCGILTVGLTAPSAVFATWARGRGTRSAFAIGSAFVGVIAALAVLTIPGLSLHPGALALAAAAAVAAPHLWHRAQLRWLERSTESVSLLAPTTPAAYEAIQRLAVVPWLRVSSVLVPDADGLRATRLLHRPVAPSVRGGPRLERRVVVSSPLRDPSVGGAIAELVARGHDLTSESSVLRTAEGRVDVSRADPLGLLLGRRLSFGADVAARALDLLVSATLLVLLAPLFLVVAIAIVLDDGFPVIYRQARVGRGGLLFHVLKFRSMRRDAESASGPVWAADGDPRITRVGRFLRRYRIDELPQLWNVLRGDMAMVGPRPERPHFNDLLRSTVPLFELRTIVRPGITGWAQVKLAYGASSDDAREKLEYDLYYVTRRSIWFDLTILAETARVVLTGTGAR